MLAGMCARFGKSRAMSNVVEFRKSFTARSVRECNGLPSKEVFLGSHKSGIKNCGRSSMMGWLYEGVYGKALWVLLGRRVLMGMSSLRLHAHISISQPPEQP